MPMSENTEAVPARPAYDEPPHLPAQPPASAIVHHALRAPAPVWPILIGVSSILMAGLLIAPPLDLLLYVVLPSGVRYSDLRELGMTFPFWPLEVARAYFWVVIFTSIGWLTLGVVLFIAGVALLLRRAISFTLHRAYSLMALGWLGVCGAIAAYAALPQWLVTFTRAPAAECYARTGLLVGSLTGTLVHALFLSFWFRRRRAEGDIISLTFR